MVFAYGSKSYLSTMFLCLRMWFTSAAVAGPWSFCPFSISFSSSSIDWRWQEHIMSPLDNIQLRQPIVRSYVPNKEKPDLPSFGKSFTNFTVTSTIAGSDEVSNTAALQEGGGGDRTGRAEKSCKCNHLHQTQTDYCCFGVITEAKAVAETCANCHNVLEENYTPITSCLSSLLPHVCFTSDHAQIVLLTALLM